MAGQRRALPRTLSRPGCALGLLPLLLLLVASVASVHAAYDPEVYKPSYEEWLQVLPYNVSTALPEYLSKPESVYSWRELPEFEEKGLGFTSYVLNVTALTWLDSSKVSRSVWWHFVQIFVPDDLEPRFEHNGFLFIHGMGNTEERPPSIHGKLELTAPQALICTLGRQVVATVYQVPNAPIQFWEEKPEPRQRGEDALIAWTWQHFLRDPSDPTWLARFPMVKSSIASMNASTEFLSSRPTGAQGQRLQLEEWVVSGASKRGWTAWLVGAFDPRVLAVVPLVYDELNFVSNIHRHYEALGGWSWALHDYASLNLTGAFHDGLFQLMMDLVDPYAYLATSRLATIPKMVISAAGDEFLLPDNINSFWSDMRGEKHFRSFPNLSHSLGGDPLGVVAALLSFSVQVQLRQARPRYDWGVDPASGVLTAHVTRPFPDALELWYAHTIDGNERRDFRLFSCPDGCPLPKKHVKHNVTWVRDDQWMERSVEGDTLTVRALAPVPEEGWVGFLVILRWKDPNGGEFSVSTGPSILPLTYPFPPCEGQGCIAGLV